MASTSETGHAKNVANFNLLIEHLNTYGAQYSPSNPDIALTALTNKYAQASAALKSHFSIKVTYDDAVNAREIQFKDIRTLTSRIIGSLEASGATPQKIKDAKTVARKIRGERAPGKKTKQNEQHPPVDPAIPVIPSGAEGEGERTKTISTSQLSYDQRTSNFSKLVEIVQSEPRYNPTQSDLTVSALQSYSDQLLQSTGVVAGKIAAYTASITQRDQELYADESGLHTLAKYVKSYIKSMYGTASPQYKTVNSISVQKIKR